VIERGPALKQVELDLLDVNIRNAKTEFTRNNEVYGDYAKEEAHVLEAANEFLMFAQGHRPGRAITTANVIESILRL
jgi:hypothetical protein